MKTTRLGDHVAFLSGFAFKSKHFNTDGIGLPLVRIRDVVSGMSETFYSGDYDDRYVVQSGDCLIGMDGEFNLGYWQSGKALLNQRVCKVGDVSPEIDRGYLARFLALALKHIEEITPFVTVKHLSVKTLSDARIPLPSLPEQKRIAAALDAVDALRIKRRESIEELDSLSQATFLEMFGHPLTNPKGWPTRRLKDFVERLDGGKNVAQAENETEYRVLKVSAVTYGEYRPDESKWLPPSFNVPASYLVRRGDLLISRANTVELIGATAYVWQTPPKIVLPDKIWKFVWKEQARISPLFVFALTRHAEFRQRLGALASGTSGSMKNIAKPKLMSLEFPCPPFELQTRFAGIVEAIELQKAQFKAHLAELDAIFASIQSRAFYGGRSA